MGPAGRGNYTSPSLSCSINTHDDFAQQKARLAVLHCGLFYWHIRRYSRDAWYEPVSVFLATLTLWAYSSYALRFPPPGQEDIMDNMDGLRSGTNIHQGGADMGTPGVSLFKDQPRPICIQLDRPNDDEIAQLFVMSGRPSAMRAYITGVGDIYSPQGAVNILREGRRILGGVSSAWGHNKEYASLLEVLEQTTIQNQLEGTGTPFHDTYI